MTVDNGLLDTDKINMLDGFQGWILTKAAADITGYASYFAVSMARNSGSICLNSTP